MGKMISSWQSDKMITVDRVLEKLHSIEDTMRLTCTPFYDDYEEYNHYQSHNSSGRIQLYMCKRDHHSSFMKISAIDSIQSVW